MSEVAEAPEPSPHGRLFYGFAVLLGLASAGFFGVVSMSSASETEPGWRVAFSLPVVMFMLGAAQAAERLWWPGRAAARAAGWPARVRTGLFWGRWLVLGVACLGAGGLTIARHMVSPEAMEVCDDLRVLCWTLLFLCFCLADAIGERMLDGSKLWQRLATPAPQRRPRRRRSGLTTQGGPG